MNKNGKEKPVKVDDGWKGYVNWNPAAADREKAGALLDDQRWEIGDAIDTLVESGYTVSFSHEETTGAVRLAVTGKRKPCDNIGYTLSVRASSAIRVVALAHVYVYDLCQGGDWLFEKEGKDVW